jgi:hypothetical protein
VKNCVGRMPPLDQTADSFVGAWRYRSGLLGFLLLRVADSNDEAAFRQSQAAVSTSRAALCKMTFSPGSSRQPRSGHAPQPTTPSGVPTHPGKQLSAVFAGRPRGRLNTDHNSDADRVGPNSGQPGNTTPRGPSPPRSIVRRALQLASPLAQHPLRRSHFCALCHSARLGTTFGHSAPAPPCNIHPRGINRYMVGVMLFWVADLGMWSEMQGLWSV